MAKAEEILFHVVIGGYFLTLILYFAQIAARKDGLAKAALALHALSVLVHTAGLVIRGIQAGRLPLTNQYEFASCFAWALALVGLVFILKYGFPALGAFVMPVVFLVIGYAALQSREVRPLADALRSYWLFFHVSTVIIAYGSFGVSFALGAAFLLRERIRKDSYLDRQIPRKEILDLMEYRSVCLGLVFLTFTMITGAIWAEQAWGSYWSWDPKETWSLVTWIVYAVYLHLRLRRGWKGKAAAIFAVAGFLCVLFTYAGVNTLLPGLHSYA